jgi:probable rRNA maturation factor
MANGTTVHDTSASEFQVSLANQQSTHDVDVPRLVDAARRVLAGSRFTAATISLAVVDDPTIHDLNRQFLEHDWPTDVLSFVLDTANGRLNGEVILSADTAANIASEGKWPAADEQLLYVIHGMLHLIGMDDVAEAEAAKMRAAERYYLQECGVAAEVAARMAKSDVEQLDDNVVDSESAGGGGTAAW